jgi:hypothetical protein
VTGLAADGASLDELRRRLVAELEMLAETLHGAPSRLMSTRQQLRFGSKGALVIELHRNRGIWFSHESGKGGDVFDLIADATKQDFAGAVRWAWDWLGMAPAGQPATAPPPRPAASLADLAKVDARKLALAVSVWRASIRSEGSPVENYLRARGCWMPGRQALRYNPACPRGSERLPAMIALMTDPVTNEPVGIHRTFLRADGVAKIEHGTAKMMLGAAGVVRLVNDEDVALGLGIAEGIETSLAIMRHAGWRPVWAVGSAGGIRGFPVLSGIECLTIFPDADASGTGQKAAEACAQRWLAAGHEVAIVTPPVGQDWDDRFKEFAA